MEKIHVYFDESYPTNPEILILGSLFLPKSASRYLHKKLLLIKKAHGIIGELKYTKLNSKRQYDAAAEIVDLFFTMRDGYFRSIVIPYDEKRLAKISDGELDKKRLGLYVDSATKLIINNLEQMTEANIFMDEERRLEKIKFHNKLAKIRPFNAKINSVTAVKSHHDGNCLMQLCDLLTGGILQDLYPTEGKRGRYKKQFGEFLRSKVELLDFKEKTWEKITITKARKTKMKIHLGYWQVPDFTKYNKRKKAKSRS